MSKQRAAQPQPKSSARLATTLSIIAIIVSVLSAGLSWWLNYESSLPAISAKAELTEPLTPGQQIHCRVLLENNGRTTAKHLQPTIAWKFSRADIPFEATYDLGLTTVAQSVPVADLVSAGHETLYSTTDFTLAHDDDVNAVLRGQWNLYVYGKIPYRDIFHFPHELHFCGYYRQVPGSGPLKFNYCLSYNDTD